MNDLIERKYTRVFQYKVKRNRFLLRRRGMPEDSMAVALLEKEQVIFNIPCSLMFTGPIFNSKINENISFSVQTNIIFNKRPFNLASDLDKNIAYMQKLKITLDQIAQNIETTQQAMYKLFKANGLLK